MINQETPPIPVAPEAAEMKRDEDDKEIVTTAPSSSAAPPKKDEVAKKGDNKRCWDEDQTCGQLCAGALGFACCCVCVDSCCDMDTCEDFSCCGCLQSCCEMCEE